jgi:MFS family permease
MHGSDFNLATSIFFVGYLMMQLPSNLLITRLPPSIYLSCAATVWGVVSTCNGAVQSFGQLVAVRLILGFVECPFFPGKNSSTWNISVSNAGRLSLTDRFRCHLPDVVVVHPLRINKAYLLVLLRQCPGEHVRWAFGTFFLQNAQLHHTNNTPSQAAGILENLDGSMGIAGWRWLFIIEGVITIGVAIAAGFILPDYPATTKWLSEEERNFASWRLMVDINETDDTHSRSIWEGVKLCLTDYRLYLFVLTQHLSILSQTFQYFFPSIVQTLGFGKIETLLLTVPGEFTPFPPNITACLDQSC